MRSVGDNGPYTCLSCWIIWRGVCNSELLRSHGVWDSPVFWWHSFVQSHNCRGLDILFRIVDPLVVVVFYQQVGLSGRVHRRVDRLMWSGVRKIHPRCVASSCIQNWLHDHSNVSMRDWCDGILSNFLIKSCSSARIVVPVGRGANDGNVPINAVAISRVIVRIAMILML